MVILKLNHMDYSTVKSKGLFSKLKLKDYSKVKSRGLFLS